MNFQGLECAAYRNDVKLRRAGNALNACEECLGSLNFDLLVGKDPQARKLAPESLRFGEFHDKAG